MLFVKIGWVPFCLLGAAQFLGMEDAAPDGAGLILAFYHQSVAPTAREGWREPAKQRSCQPR